MLEVVMIHPVTRSRTCWTTQQLLMNYQGNGKPETTPNGVQGHHWLALAMNNKIHMLSWMPRGHDLAWLCFCLSQPFIVALIDRFFVAIFCPLIDPNHYCIYMMLFNSVPIATPSYLYIHVANSIQFCASLYIHVHPCIYMYMHTANLTQFLAYTATELQCTLTSGSGNVIMIQQCKDFCIYTITMISPWKM